MSGGVQRSEEGCVQRGTRDIDSAGGVGVEQLVVSESLASSSKAGKVGVDIVTTGLVNHREGVTWRKGLASDI